MVEGEDSSAWLCRKQGEKQQKASRHPGKALCVTQRTPWIQNHSCLAFISPCACKFINADCGQLCNLTQKCYSWAQLFPVGMRGRNLCLFTYKIQPEMLAAKGTNDSLQKNARVQSSKRALTEAYCPGRCYAAVMLHSNPLLSVPCQGQSQGSGRRSGTAKKLRHVARIAFVAVGTKLALTVIVGKVWAFPGSVCIVGSSGAQEVYSSDR